MKLDIQAKPKIPLPTTSKQEKYLHDVPSSMKGLFRRAYEKIAPRAAAIKAKCLDCSCYQREEVALCAVQTCPLWHYRPFQTKRSPAKTATNV